jgi:hypothetical protein
LFVAVSAGYIIASFIAQAMRRRGRASTLIPFQSRLSCGARRSDNGIPAIRQADQATGRAEAKAATQNAGPQQWRAGLDERAQYYACFNATARVQAAAGTGRKMPVPSAVTCAARRRLFERLALILASDARDARVAPAHLFALPAGQREVLRGSSWWGSHRP